MKDFKLDSNHDLAFENHDFQMVENGEEVAQNWRIRMLWLYGEWVFNRALGMPWLNKIFKLSASPIEKRDLIMSATLAIPGVKAIRSIEQTTDENHKGFLTMTVSTDYNTVEDLTL